MNVVYKGFGMLKSMYNQLNPATLTGAIDILVVDQPDGTMIASPFHVRFGKLGVLRAKEKVVNIDINNDRVDNLHMKLGDQGEAFFVIEITEDEEAIPSGLITSPLPSRPCTPTGASVSIEEDIGELQHGEDAGKRKRRKKRKRRNPVVVDQQRNDAEESEDADDDPEPLPLHSRSSSRSSTEGFLYSNLNGIPTISVEAYYHSDASQSSSCSSSGAAGVPGDAFDDRNRRQPMSSMENLTATQLTTMQSQSDSELNAIECLEHTLEEKLTLHPFSDSEPAAPSGPHRTMRWGWGQLPGTTTDDVIEHHHDRNVKEQQQSATRQDDNPASSATDGNTPHFITHFRAIDTAKEESDGETQPQSSPNTTTSPSETTSKKRNISEGLYLDDVLSLDPLQANLYLKSATGQEVTSSKNGSSVASDRAASPAGFGSDVDSGTDCQTQDETSDCPMMSSTPELDSSEVTISLCGSTAGTAVDPEKFAEKLISYEAFLESPLSYVNDPNLTVKIGERYLNWQTAQPMIMSLAVFKRPLTQPCVDRLITSSQQIQQPSRLGWWLWRRPNRAGSISEAASTASKTTEDGAGVGSSADNNNPDDNNTVATIDQVHKTVRDAPQRSGIDQIETTLEAIAGGGAITGSGTSCDEAEVVDLLLVPRDGKGRKYGGLQPGTKHMRKTTRLSSEQLEKLNLKPGANQITFSVTSQYQGTKRCYATVYRWKWSDKIVVSDIDGTITKSDVFGQILPVVGKDWTHMGIAQLYHNISTNGYKFIYLSSRAIGQYSMTKGYLNWINQQGVSLPPGPLLLSPTSLMMAFRREVIEKTPEKFKIECLKDIQALFPDNPFYAGFGNKTNDVTAYKAVGISSTRMFTINHRGEVKQDRMPTYTTTYSDLGGVVDNFFPHRDPDQPYQSVSTFTEFTYWRNEYQLSAEDFDHFGV